MKKIANQIVQNHMQLLMRFAKFLCVLTLFLLSELPLIAQDPPIDQKVWEQYSDQYSKLIDKKDYAALVPVLDYFLKHPTALGPKSYHELLYFRGIILETNNLEKAASDAQKLLTISYTMETYQDKKEFADRNNWATKFLREHGYPVSSGGSMSGSSAKSSTSSGVSGTSSPSRTSGKGRINEEDYNKEIKKYLDFIGQENYTAAIGVMDNVLSYDLDICNRMACLYRRGSQNLLEGYYALALSDLQEMMLLDCSPSTEEGRKGYIARREIAENKIPVLELVTSGAAVVGGVEEIAALSILQKPVDPEETINSRMTSNYIGRLSKDYDFEFTNSRLKYEGYSYKSEDGRYTRDENKKTINLEEVYKDGSRFKVEDLDLLKCKDLRNQEEFQVQVNGQILTPRVEKVSPDGRYFVFKYDGNQYIFDLDTRKATACVGRNILFNPVASNYFSVWRENQDYYSGRRALVKTDLKTGVSEALYELGSSEGRSDDSELRLSKSRNPVNQYLVLPGVKLALSVLDPSKRITKDVLLGFSENYRYGFSANSIYEMKTMSRVYTFNPMYKIRSIEDGLIKLDFQGKQTHFYSLDRIVVFGKYYDQIKTDFAQIPEKSEFETESEASTRITQARAGVMQKYENQLAEQKKNLAKRIRESYQEKTFRIESIGTYVAEKEEFPVTVNGVTANIKVPRSEAQGFKANYAQAKITAVEQLDEGGVKTRVFNYRITNPVTGSVYPFGLQMSPLYIDDSNKNSGDSGIPKLEMTAKLMEPSGNNLIDGNEECQIEISITNSGTGAAQDVRLNMEGAQVSGLKYENAAKLTGIAPQQSQKVVLNVKTDRSLATGSITFKINAAEKRGFDPAPISLTLNTQEYLKPQLVYIESVITELTGDKDNIIENNEIIEVSALIQNKGQGIAEESQVLFSLNNENIISTESATLSQKIGALKPGESRNIRFVFTVNNRYSGSDVLPISIALTEKYQSYGGTFPLGLELKKVSMAAKSVQISGQYAQRQEIAEASLSSEVDKNIPDTGKKYENRYALIIGNEHYSANQPGLNSESDVAFAVNDANAFSKYAELTLGIPKENITVLADATSIKMKFEVQKLSTLTAKRDDLEIYFFYAGHGFPDQDTKEGYLIPVDVTGANFKEGYKLSDLYHKLTEHPSKQVTVFLDACFSGGGRGAGLLAARGVKIKPKDEALKGNLVAFTASSGDQVSLPYQEKMHGMFTYYLLKKLQETKGNVSYGELGDFISKSVSFNSVKVNNKEQDPTVIFSPNLESSWKNLHFKQND